MAEIRELLNTAIFPDERRTQKVADIRKLFCAAVIKLRPNMSSFLRFLRRVQAAALSLKTEFDTDNHGVIDGKGHLPAKAWASPNERMPLASAPIRTCRLNLDTANPNSEHLPGTGIKGQGRIQGSPAQLGRLISLSRPPSPCPGGSGCASGNSGGESCGSGMSEASKQYLLSMSLTPIQSGKSEPARAVLAAVEHT